MKTQTHSGQFCNKNLRNEPLWKKMMLLTQLPIAGFNLSSIAKVFVSELDRLLFASDTYTRRQ